MLISCGSGNYIVKPGQAFFVYPHMAHSVDSANGEYVAYDVIKLDMHQFSDSSSYAPQMYAIFGDIARRGLPQLFDKTAVEEMGLPFKMRLCIRESHEKVYGYDLVIKSFLYVILTGLLRQWMKKGFSVEQEVFQSELFASIDSVTSYIE